MAPTRANLLAPPPAAGAAAGAAPSGGQQGKGGGSERGGRLTKAEERAVGQVDRAGAPGRGGGQGGRRLACPGEPGGQRVGAAVALLGRWPVHARSNLPAAPAPPAPCPAVYLTYFRCGQEGG